MNFKTCEEVYRDAPKSILHLANKLQDELKSSVKQLPDIKCLHLICSQCKGTGIKKDGTRCVHYLSCPCKNCTIKM